VILCHCAVVSDRDIHACVADGSRTVSEVLGRTGAGQQCGGCVLAVRACARRALSTTVVSDAEVEVLHEAG
jgi:bacterioferritin-associated ferredoxin